MRTKTASLALAGALLGATAGGLALGATGIASASDDTTSATAAADDSARLARRTADIKEALAGLVSAGTITQAQADKVAATLATTLRGPGPGRGHGPGMLRPEAVAGILGITVEELRSAREAGKTLTQIAAAEGISKADLIDKLVAAAKAELAAAVKAGRLTQAQADANTATLEERVTARVDEVRPPRPDGPPPGVEAAPSAAA
jgi:hypothetical protein